MKLINVIEINPLNFSKEGSALPEVSDFPDPEDWYDEWVKTVSILDFDFNTISKGSYLVDIESVDDRNLEIILQGIEFDEFEDEILPFDGGIALMEDNKALLLPTCCGDIGNIQEWKKILEDKTQEWNDLWIGHPWVFYKKNKGKIQFSDYSDENLKDITDIKSMIEIDELELKTELMKAEQQQINFQNRISKTLEKLKIENFDKISQSLTGISKMI
ncbi:hypothetical protein CLU96_1348 [Chryseobacterium sp. 52]|uniref:hypothetical protein n=1 Tax=Chryseobacterium sp. 52 TaxID=2035213 RepID=UPI000C19DE45|nr:hypothetical protein [Chryseobacterium sp. 52]PIF44382.1 hypothetical protein CLU96_1348 [Chryseobacterium sp. 52]